MSLAREISTKAAYIISQVPPMNPDFCSSHTDADMICDPLHKSPMHCTLTFSTGH